ncbi:ATP-dependent helicase [Promicromonospora sp. NPDC050249]|uniref:ATP-dependent helicase n=1 Tax=Promicromonospora sp. NPDC050249 TaxID=3154743 RepID=UPI0033D0F8FF
MIPSPQEWRPHGIQDLEPAAWAALRAGTASVTAGPGSGKSEFLAQRAGYLLETGICRPPQQILAISFKRAAATNLRDRVKRRLPEHAHRFTSMTFDAFTKSIVDRFRGLLPSEWALGADYKIAFSTKREVEAFFADVAGGLDQRSAQAVYALSADTFLPHVLGATELSAVPSEQPAPTSASEFAVREWWNRSYLQAQDPVVDFVMLNRLADLIIRTSPQLQRALRATYPFVFVDEFQDTTYAQYSFLRAVFAHEGTTVTAVGDRKQRIMGWAGALGDAFAQFEADFAAEPFTFTSNFRSTQQLVDLQQRFAVRLDPDSPPQRSRVEPPVGETPVAVWSFPTTEREADAIAAWIATDIEGSGRRPSDYALIARQQVVKLEPDLARALSAAGLRLRNDDAQVGEIRLQDLLTDDLVRLLLGILALAANKGGQPQIWREVTSILSGVSPGASGREVGTQVEDDLTDYLQNLRRWLAATPLDDDSGIDLSEETAVSLTNQLTDFVRVEAAGHKRLFGSRPEDLTVTLEAFRTRLTQTLLRVDSWSAVADAFFDEDAVPLLTVHRSKGLEYHTVFFIGLDSDQWWAHARNTIESTMTFFVGVSRAAERLIFTQCDQRGAPAPLGELYQDLRDAGVPLVRFD